MSESIGQWTNITELTPWKDNPRHNEEAIDKVASSIKRFGFASPIIARSADKMIIAGHTRFEAAKKIGLKSVPVRFMNLDMDDAQLLALADNRIGEIADWDEAKLQELLSSFEDEDLTGLGWSDEELTNLVNTTSESEVESLHASLSDDFGVPPFSILDTRQGYWVQRKAKWQSLIQEKGESRQQTLFNDKSASRLAEITKGSDKPQTVSILDPVLAEIACQWFGLGKGTKVYDPFAGDTVFGYVSGFLGFEFIGTELRQEQVDINSQRTKEFNCKYICDDARNANDHIKKESQDFIFSCPPYADLEVYSDDPRDISNMSHESFFEIYKEVLQNTYSLLKEDRFCFITISEVRDTKTGAYISLVPKTIKFMTDAGYKFWNELILINMVGTLRVRARRPMQINRKVGRTHQNILVFYKGDTKNIKSVFPDIDLKIDESYKFFQEGEIENELN